ncbi:MAG: hypothetical protein H0V89_02315 [Deltaproteobacteria bacterium]|nr:hypothetical protein [Deltaproteobacteria bacterium]
MWWTLAAAALAQDSRATLPRPVAGHPVLEVRGGLVASPGPGPAAPPTVCVEGYPTSWLSFEACGNGSGYWHDAPAPDFLHLRARTRVAGVQAGRSSLDLVVGAGLAEIQSTADRPGFVLGVPTDPEPVEAAGPEASLTLRGRHWVDPAARLYTTAGLDAGAAAIAGAPRVLGTAGQIVPFVQLTVGLGF